MRAFLDDTAQIVGPKFEFSQQIKGRSERETEICRFVLDKAQLVYNEAQKIGGVRIINPVESLLMRRVYLMKYSKNEEGGKKTKTSADTPEAKADFPEEEFPLRQALVDYGNKLVEENLVQGTWGNLSVRLDDRYMLVTPSGIDYKRLAAADMVKVDIETLEYGGNLKPTSEKGLHAAIYKNRPDVKAVIHTHSTYCSVFAAAEKRLPIVIPEARKIFGTNVKLATYGLPGTDKLAKATAQAVGENFGAIMSHHGMVALGKDMETAFENCVTLENCARAVLKA